jgi:UDP-N-acetylmuramoyl-tripeptide--D-alanyl-D-alanine ligase
VIRLNLEIVARELGCEPPRAAPEIHGVAIDSRAVQAGNLFAALAGARSDGHDYLAAAAAAGAVAALVSRPVDHPLPQLVVADVQVALGQLAAYWRDQYEVCVAAITGSNGKTTTREMVSNILARPNNGVLATAGNYNNELGLPLTLFGLGSQHRYAVLELGAARPGDIRYLARICKPRVGLVTNVGPAHLQGFGSEEGVARAKGELYQELPPDGTAVINADETWSAMWQEMSGAGQSISFGRVAGCDVYAKLGGRDIEVHTPTGAFRLRMSLPGEHNLQNALAATAMAVALEIPVEQIRAGLEATRPVPGRLNLVHSERGWIVIDDTYNANPASLYAALQVLAHQGGEPWLVLGDMKELGPNSRRMHAEMGEAARSLGVARLFAVGEASQATVDAFGEGGRHFGKLDELIGALDSELRSGVTCLVKGSRSMGMERVVRAISADDMREAS